MKSATIIILLAIAVFAAVAFSGKSPDFEAPKQKLSDYGFFTGRLADLIPAKKVIPYDLNSALFSNYAEKSRFIVLPEGEPAIYNPDSAFNMPVGTVLIKNFYFPADFRHPEKGRKILETRLLVHEPAGWNALPYIWNKEQTEAYYDVAGDTRQVQYTDSKGKKVNTSYVIPNKNQCKGCHSSGNRFLPIGISARHLNKDFSYADGAENQLTFWKKHGLLNELPEDKIPANCNWQDESKPLEARARAYLDINCGHCHNSAGPANTSGLFLDIHNKNETSLGIMKTPVAAGRGSGNLDYAIVPGRPDKSILLYRMNTTDPGIAMPEIGREQIHKEGIELISRWISSMKQ
ncbi:hypothetical protein BC349_04395 [Flavihumibacter stibioxidans]|uniref:Repeat protein (TIGR03806 family) n=1 Tax=Flavihumibacter stibioxidans TaxID=1834163 RepID=A0ABR7M6E6_9BACT|nr:hypothetical protein [Flavihumibacter stibioxidans]